MIVLGVILILVGYLLPVPAIIATIDWILLVIGIVLLGQVGRPVGGRAIGADSLNHRCANSSDRLRGSLRRWA